MNKVVLIGRWTKEVDLKFLPGNGTANAQSTIAVDRKYQKDKEKEADFLPVIMWGKTAENAANYTKKGSKVAVVGRIQTRSYEAKDGTGKRYITEIVADEVEFLDSKSASQGGQRSTQGNQGGGYENFSGKGNARDVTPENYDDGEIPF